MSRCSAQESCIICMNQDSIANLHPCSVCVKDAWKICRECSDKIDTCPVCRTAINPVNPKNIKNIEINVNSRHYECQKKLLDCLYYLLRPPILFIICVYLGKVYIYLYCSGTCSEREDYDKCFCRNYAHQDGYWKISKYCFLEFLLCVVASAIMFTCCCIKN